jgi:hypothetical protein
VTPAEAFVEPDIIRAIEHPVDLLFFVWNLYHNDLVLTESRGHAGERDESPK